MVYTYANVAGPPPPPPTNLPPTTSNVGTFQMLNTETVTIDPLASAYDDQNEINPASFQFMVGGVAQSNPYVAASVGTWSVSAGDVTFDPLNTFVGTASVGYRVADLDGAYSNISTITINVTEPVVVAPTCACNTSGQDNDCCTHVGVPLGMDGPGNIPLRNINTLLAQPFCCRETGVITHYSVNFKYSTNRAGYSAGNLGDIQTCLYNADETGNPYGSPLGCHIMTDPSEGGPTFDHGNLGKWAFPSTIPVTAGQHYALVHNNVGTNPNENWCSINLGRDYPHAGVLPDYVHRQYATGNFVNNPRMQGPGDSWHPTTNAPNWYKGDPNASAASVNGSLYWHNNAFAVYMASGTRMGSDYVSGRFGDEFTMNATNWVRTKFKVHSEKITTGPLHFKAMLGVAGGTVTGRLMQNGSLIRTVTLSPSGDYWYTGTVSPAVTFNPANSYSVDWSSSVGISTRAIATSVNDQGWEEDHSLTAVDNHLFGHGYERSTNSGSTWSTPNAGAESTTNFYFETECVGAPPGGTLSFTTGVSNETAAAGGSATFDWVVWSSNGCTPITYTVQTTDGITTWNQGTTQNNSWTFAGLLAEDTGTTVIVTASCPGNTSVQDTGTLTVTGGGAGLPANSRVFGAFHSFGSEGLNPDPAKNMPVTMQNQVTAAGWIYDGRINNGGSTPAAGLSYVQAAQSSWSDCDCMFIDYGINHSGESTAAFVADAMAINNFIRGVVPDMKIIWANIYTTNTNIDYRIGVVNPGVQQMYANGDIDGIADWYSMASANPGLLSSDGTHCWENQNVWMSTFITAAQQIA